MAQAPRGRSWDPTVIIVLLVCVLIGMAQGARGLVNGAGDRVNTSARLEAAQAQAQSGTVRAASAMCKDTPNALDTVRWTLTDARGRAVARQVNPLVAGRERQTATLGSALPDGRYKVTCTCLANQEPVGDDQVADVVLDGLSAGAAAESSYGSNRPGLPRTGRR